MQGGKQHQILQNGFHYSKALRQMQYANVGATVPQPKPRLQVADILPHVRKVGPGKYQYHGNEIEVSSPQINIFNSNLERRRRKKE